MSEANEITLSGLATLWFCDSVKIGRQSPPKELNLTSTEEERFHRELASLLIWANHEALWRYVGYTHHMSGDEWSVRMYGPLGEAFSTTLDRSTTPSVNDWPRRQSEWVAEIMRFRGQPEDIGDVFADSVLTSPTDSTEAPGKRELLVRYAHMIYAKCDDSARRSIDAMTVLL